MYTYVQLGCNKVNTATYIHTGGVSNAYSRIRTARVRVHAESVMSSCSSAGNRLDRNGEIASSCSSRSNGMHHVHREPTGLDGTADRNQAWRTAEWRKRFVFDRLGSKRD